jgi:hypothetical protein
MLARWLERHHAAKTLAGLAMDSAPCLGNGLMCIFIVFPCHWMIRVPPGPAQERRQAKAQLRSRTPVRWLSSMNVAD